MRFQSGAIFPTSVSKPVFVKLVNLYTECNFYPMTQLSMSNSATDTHIFASTGSDQNSFNKKF